MDPLTALSLAGTIVQFIDFSSKLVSAGRHLYADSRLKVHEQVTKATDDLLDFTAKLQQSLRSPDVPVCLTEDEAALEDLCQNCIDLAGKLRERLDRLTVTRQGPGRIWSSLKAAVSSVCTEDELFAFQGQVENYRRAIDSRVMRSLSQRVDLISLQQSERFDRLDYANKQIATALVDARASDKRGLEAQISALSLLLDRAEFVIANQENAAQRIVINVFQGVPPSLGSGEIESLIDGIRDRDQAIRGVIATELLQSLRFKYIKERFEAVDEAHRKTFEWIFQIPQNSPESPGGTRRARLGEWLESGSGIYWVNGKAGSGKSTLMKYVVNHHRTTQYLRRWAWKTKLCIASFFFWNSGSKLQMSQIGLFRSLLFDILHKNPELIPVVFPAPWASRYTAKCQSNPPPSESWLLSTLQSAFQMLVSQTVAPLKICLFIDGLDEYEGGDGVIAEIFGKASLSKNVKICCSSRPHQVFQDAFASRPGLRLQDLTFPDIQQYVSDKLENHGRMLQLMEEDPEDAKALISEISTAANGVFLWVRLVVASLLSGLGQHDDIVYLQKRLRELPEELDDLYHHMVFKVDKVYQEETSQLFQLVSASSQESKDEYLAWRETEQLSILLLSFASEKDPLLAINAEAEFLTSRQVLARCQKMEVILRTRCGGLIEVHYGNTSSDKPEISPLMKVSYLHRTVKDFLNTWTSRKELSDRTGGLAKDAFKPHHAIFKAHILMLKVMRSVDLLELPPWGWIEDSFTWARRGEQETQSGQLESVDAFYEVARASWNEPHDTPKPFFEQPESMMGLAARCGLHHYIEEKLTQNPRLVHMKQERSLLDYALVPMKHAELFISIPMVETLLKFGADPNVNSANGYTPWQNALSYLHVVVPGIMPEWRRSFVLIRWAVIVKMLLQTGANPNTGCQEPTQLVTVRGKKLPSGHLWPIEEVIAKAFVADLVAKANLMRLLEEARSRSPTCEPPKRSVVLSEQARKQLLHKHKAHSNSLRSSCRTQ